MSKRSTIYTRVSSLRQAAEDRSSLETQLDDCRKLASERGFEVVAELQDIASGTRKNRKGYKQLVQMIRNGEVDVVIAWAEDRLYRGFSVVPLYEALQELPVPDDGKGEVTIELVHGHFDRSMMAIMAGIAQKEIEDIRRRTEAGRRASVREGKLPPGPVKFGYRRDAEGRAEVDPQQAATVQTIFELYVDGVPWMEIRSRLSALGMHTVTGLNWKRSALSRVINDATYVTGQDLHVRKSGGTQESFEIPYPTIIDQGLWNKAQARREANKTRWRAHHVKADALSVGLAVCGVHGHKMRLKPRRSGDIPVRFQCEGGRDAPERNGPECARTIGAKKLDRLVVEQMMKLTEDPAILKNRVAEQLTDVVDRQGDAEAMVERLEARLSELSAERKAMLLLFRRGRISEAELDKHLDEIERDTAELKNQTAQRKAEVTAGAQAQDLLETVYGSVFGEHLGAFASMFRHVSDSDLSMVPNLFAEGSFREAFESRFDSDLSIPEIRNVLAKFIDHVEVRTVDGEKVVRPFFRLEVPLQFTSSASGSE